MVSANWAQVPGVLRNGSMTVMPNSMLSVLTAASVISANGSMCASMSIDSAAGTMSGVQMLRGTNMLIWSAQITKS